MGGKGEGLAGTTIKDTWTKPRNQGREAGVRGRDRGKGRQLYLNNNKI